MNKNERIFGLDLMRCIAIMLVLIDHARYFIPMQSSRYFILLGFVGVEMFFVLSGFLIGGILIKTFEKEATASSLKIFWIRRWFRTLPNYYLFLLLNIVIVVFLKPPHIEMGFVGGYFLFLQNLAWPKSSFFSVSWSLCVEEWFYLLYPVGVLLFKKVFRLSVKKSFLIATILFIIIPIVFRYYCLHSQHYSFTNMRMIVISRLDAMMMGVFIAFFKFYYRGFYQKTTRVMLLMGVVLTVGVISIAIFKNLDKVNVIIQTLFLTALTISFALFLPYLGELRTRSNKVIYQAIYKVSLWSYSLYLVNLPIIYVLNVFKGSNTTGMVNIICLTAFFVLSFLLSSYLYKWIEKPFLTLRDKYFKEEKPGTAVPATPIIR